MSRAKSVSPAVNRSGRAHGADDPYEVLTEAELAALRVKMAPDWLEAATDYLRRTYVEYASQLDAVKSNQKTDITTLYQCFYEGRQQIRRIGNFILDEFYPKISSFLRKEFQYRIINIENDLEDHYNVAKILSGLEIESDSQSLPAETADPRWSRLEEFAKRTRGKGVAEFGRRLFPELEGVVGAIREYPPLPQSAPETYGGLRGPETPPEFVKRVYGPWLGEGLTRAHMRKLDPTLYQAITNWLSRPGNEWPADVDLPTLKEQNDRWVDRFRAEGAAAALGPDALLTDYHRLQSAAGRRKGRMPNRE